MSYKVVVSFNSSAHADYAGTDQTFTGVYACDYSRDGFLLLNLRVDAESADDVLLIPVHTITKVTVNQE